MTRGEINLEWKCSNCRTDTAMDDMDTTPVRSPPRLNSTFSLWAPTLPDLPTIDDDLTTEIVTEEDRRPNTPDASIADVTFDLPRGDIQHPDPVIEQSMVDPVLDDEIPVDRPETFEVVVNGSKRGGRKLVSSTGYTYTVRVSTCYWCFICID